jgi:hypothetical protein
MVIRYVPAKRSVARDVDDFVVVAGLDVVFAATAGTQATDRTMLRAISARFIRDLGVRRVWGFTGVVGAESPNYQIPAGPVKGFAGERWSTVSGENSNALIQSRRYEKTPIENPT